jgi:hypothetical protein
MRKLIVSFVFLSLLSACANSTISTSFTSDSSVITSDQENSTIITPETNDSEKILSKIVSAETLDYLIDFKTITELPKTLSVTYDDGAVSEKGVNWEKPVLYYENKNSEIIKGIVEGTDFEVFANVNFQKYVYKLPLTDNLIIENDYIRLYHTRNDEHDIKNLLDYLTKEYHRVSKFFEYKSTPKFSGYILPSADESLRYMATEMNYKGDEGWGAGISKSEFLMVSPLNPPVPSAKSGVYTIAAHELFHAMHMYQLYEDNLPEIEYVPTWYVEGMATYVTQFARLNEFHHRFVDKDDFMLSDLNDRDVYRLPYDPGALAIKFLITTYGLDSFIDYVKSIDLIKAFGKNEQILSQEFRTYYNKLVIENGYGTMYFRNDFEYKEGFNEQDYLKGDVIEEKKYLSLSKYVGKLFNNELNTFLSKNNIYSDFGSGRSRFDHYYSGYIIIETSSFGNHFRASDFGILDKSPGLIISKTHNNKRVLYIYLKDGDEIEDVLNKLPRDIFNKDYNYYYE